uniref:Uncharacterized protein n=1 Tax=viral metagenome TaxID=1070528 RepID=A0A6C0KXU9_9ZZZZ
MYRIAWQEKNGFSGHGEYILTLELAQAWLTNLRQSHPEMRHWIEGKSV